ncbi:MAG: SulP family inorganic anion transporter [Alphaproteobacteria bacterium]|nr:SulP family inorganic anion transporter [Alphaproteobacteria bacterium]
MHKISKSFPEIGTNILIGLAVSIVMLNLGAALGILSGRGAFAGMLSAAVIAFVTSLCGGTRIQGSGLTAPMSTITAVIVAYSLEKLPAEVAGISADHFVNIVIFMSAIFLFLFSIFRLGRLIQYVPNLVVSGFMCGIAIIIWILQVEILFGVGRAPLEGDSMLNFLIAAITLILAFFVPVLIKKFFPRGASFLPGTLIALVVMSVLAGVFKLDVEYLLITNTLNSFSDFVTLVSNQIPNRISADILLLAAPFALQLAALCYIDTLLTSLIVDKIRSSKTRRNKEIAAQGLANGLVALIGGVPGAQSTVPSVLTVKEGATMRVAGVAAGVFILLNTIMFANLMNYIPQAVFIGILIKVGFDVFDVKPFGAYARTLRRSYLNKKTKILGHREMGFLSGTALITAFIDLILAVGAFTLSFIFYNRFFKKNKKIVDYVPR